MTWFFFSTRRVLIEILALATISVLAAGCSTPYNRPDTTILSARSGTGRDADTRSTAHPRELDHAESGNNSLSDSREDTRGAVPWGIGASDLPRVGTLSLDQPLPSTDSGTFDPAVHSSPHRPGADPTCVALIIDPRTQKALASDLRRGVVLGAARNQRTVVEVSSDSQSNTQPLPCSLGIGLSETITSWLDNRPAQTTGSRFVAVALKERDGHRGTCGDHELGHQSALGTHAAAPVLRPACRPEGAFVSVVDLTLATQRGRLRRCLARRAATDARRDPSVTSVRFGDPTNRTAEVGTGDAEMPLPMHELIITAGLSTRALSDVLKAERRRNWGWAVILSLPPDVSRLVTAWIRQNALSAPTLIVATNAGRHPEALSAAGDTDGITWASAFAPAASHSPAATFVDDYARLYQDLPSELALAGWQAAQLSGDLAKMPSSLVLPLFLWDGDARSASRCGG